MSKHDNTDFEIQFFEGVLKNRPQFAEALMALGELYTKKGLYKQGLDVDQKLSRLKPEDPIVLYNLACSYSLVQEIDKAFAAIKKAIRYGYTDIEYLQKDSDLMQLREDERFKKYITRIKKKIATAI